MAPGLQFVRIPQILIDVDAESVCSTPRKVMPAYSIPAFREDGGSIVKFFREKENDYGTF
jgi:hypothetical protein